MKWNYTKYNGDDFGIDSEDLMRALSEFFLQSGYEMQFMPFDEFSSNSMEALKDAIQRALESGELFDESQLAEMLERMQKMTAEQMEQLVERLAQQLANDGYITVDQPANSPRVGTAGEGAQNNQLRVEMTDRTVDFLGYKTLKDLLGSLGRASFGAHDTRDLSTGVETSGASKQYEFGDTMNLDVSETLFSAFRREGLSVPLELEYRDLHVHQSEYQSSCATVVMLDCSHSMILYGEDRFTPAKKVALALAHLIRTQFPGDSLRCVLFHDTAEEMRISELARVQVGPFYTNTRDGLILAQRLLAQEKKDMKQIVMITDGKPSAMTLEDGRIYKNAFGLDPMVIAKTLEEVGRCKRQGIMINTFMLANDFHLVNFVRKVSEICRGKAYFTNPYNLGEYLLMDYLNRKTRVVQ